VLALRLGAARAAGSVAPAHALETAESAPLVGETPPRFGADLRAYLTAEGSAIKFDLECPYSELQFIRVPAGYGASVRVLVIFRRGSKDQAGGDVWDQRIVVQSFEEMRDAAARIRFQRDFRLDPGNYKVEVRVTDLNGGRESKAVGSIKMPQFGEGALGLGDLEFGFCRDESTFVSLPARRYEADLAAMCVRGAIYDRSRAAAALPVRLIWAIRDEQGATPVKGDTTVAVEGSAKFVLHPRAGDLFLGTYTFELEAREGNRRWKSARDFDVETLSLPRGQNYDTVVEILSYIATPEEYDALRGARTDAQRAAAWDTFWARRDPTPDTPRNEALLDFFRRVRYANRTFAGQSVAGWRTDMGRIYIRYGAPDQVEERPATYYDPPLQIWHYFTLNKRFVFADREGFGRYELQNAGGDR
jgi:GWxTD domain-containing protein